MRKSSYICRDCKGEIELLTKWRTGNRCLNCYMEHKRVRDRIAKAVREARRNRDPDEQPDINFMQDLPLEIKPGKRAGCGFFGWEVGNKKT